jgi:hypothetical protein
VKEFETEKKYGWIKIGNKEVYISKEEVEDIEWCIRYMDKDLVKEIYKLDEENPF